MRISTHDVSPLRHQRDGLDGLSPQPAHDPMLPVLELSRIVVGDMALNEVLTRVARVAKDTVPGADEVTVTLVHRDHPSTAAYTGDLALGLDERQYAEGYGPCLQAARSGETQLVSDMSTETRWPKFAAQGVRDGALSSLSVALPTRQETLGASNIETVGALNIYARTRNAFGEGAQQIAPHLAGYAAVAIINASLYVTTTALSEQMSKVMDSRAVIEQAKGILMGERRCSAMRPSRSWPRSPRTPTANSATSPPPSSTKHAPTPSRTSWG